MVRTGHAAASASAAIPELPYAPPPGVTAPGLEVLTLSELRARGGLRLSDPQRPDFHQLFAVESGTLRQSVDFTEHATGPGGWLWVRPGQVQQYTDPHGAEGSLVLFRPAFPDPATAAAVGLDEASDAVARQPGDRHARAVGFALDHLRFEFAAEWQPPARGTHEDVLRHLLAVLLRRLVSTPGAHGTEAAQPPDAFRRFRAAVEADFARTRRVADYARALGYSPRTLSRATRAAVGLGAKEFVDRRVVLEAKRLLAHTDRSAARIGTALGFADATNFAKFFHQRTGATPGAFRASVRS
ncbi:helix-turn-helix transcriptional regulator [Streptomyces sp. NPDC006990]|uniref:helix-turn-helix domain-containing protein n=1 Tax=Streptomyces sp. NPDC006990 TaxID=3154481 RepID=UPI0034554843